MKLYELINPSDPYTFYAPDITVAGFCACTLSTQFGAKEVGGEESTPVIFGWAEWVQEQGIGTPWIESHLAEIADAFDSFLIGRPDHRRDIEELLNKLPEEERKKARDERQERQRTSLSRIGETAYRYAQRYREAAQKQAQGAAS